MKSKVSFFNQELIENNMKRFWWAGVLYAILMFLLSVLIVLTNNVERMIEYGRKINFGSLFDPGAVLLFVIPVLFGTMIFRYMQNSKSVTLLHQMPYTRGELYRSNFISGIILLILPILLNSAILFTIQGFTQYGIILPLDIIWKWILIHATVGISLYSVTVMVGMFTGSSIAQIIFTYILNILPPALFAVTNYIFYGMIYGFRSNDSLLYNIMRGVPLFQPIVYNDPYKYWIIIDIIWIILSFSIGYIVYKNRNLERAGDVISNDILKPVFKYGVTTCTMITGVAYVKAIFNEANPNLLIYLIFALLGYVIAEMLLRKSFKVLDSYKGFIGFVGIFAILVFAIKIDLTGFERYIPNNNEISAVAIGYFDNAKDIFDENNDRYYNKQILNSEENIKNIVDFHSDIISNRNNDFDIAHGTINIAYKLKNGKTVSRAYRITENNKYLLNIYNTTEYKNKKYEILKKDENKLRRMVISKISNEKENEIEVNDVLYAKEFLKLSKETILELSYQEFDERGEDLYYLHFEFEREREESDEDVYTYPEYADKSTVSRYDSIVVTVNKNAVKLLNLIRESAYGKILDNKI